MIDDGINRDGRLTGLTVTDDQLTLAPSDGYHGVDGLDAGLQRGIHALTGDHAACHALDLTIFGRLDGSLAVNGLAQGVHDTPHHGVAYGNLHHASGGLHNIALAKILRAAKEHDADIVLLQVEHHAIYAAGELKQFTLHCFFQTMHAGNAVCHLDDRAHVGHFQLGRISLDLLLDHGAYFFRSQIHESAHLSISRALAQLNL